MIDPSLGAIYRYEDGSLEAVDGAREERPKSLCSIEWDEIRSLLD